MKELADSVWHLKCLPGLPWAVNAYLAGDVLIDAGCRQSTRRILKQLDGHEVTAHALTHAHPDHQGASDAVCQQLGDAREHFAHRHQPHAHHPFAPRAGPQGRQDDQ